MQIYKSHKHFCRGHTSVNDDPHCRWLSTLTNENTEHVPNVMWSDWWKISQEISVQTGISVGSIHSIAHKDLNMHYLYQHMIPKMLTPEHKNHEWLLLETLSLWLIIFLKLLKGSHSVNTEERDDILIYHIPYTYQTLSCSLFGSSDAVSGYLLSHDARILSISISHSNFVYWVLCQEQLTETTSSFLQLHWYTVLLKLYLILLRYSLFRSNRVVKGYETHNSYTIHQICNGAFGYLLFIEWHW